VKRFVKLAAIIGATSAIMGSAGLATPSTLVWIPSTDIHAEGVMHYGTDYYGGKSIKPLYVHGLTFGSGKFEYGVDYATLADDSSTWFHGKVALVEESETMPKVVFGIYNAGKKEDGSPNFIYALGSKTLDAARIHAGIATGRSSVLGDDNTMLLLGADKAFNSKWWGAVDYQGGKSGYGALNVGVAYSFTPKTSLIVGRDFYNDNSLDDTWTFQLDVNY
jgi:hypothetical protein